MTGVTNKRHRKAELQIVGVLRPPTQRMLAGVVAQVTGGQPLTPVAAAFQSGIRPGC
jgi:hypothetical protein